ncbi:MAG: hypothetical protein PVI66_11880 [Candidatus Aminicenantes bacterium]|jgi:hypothetical protein
MNPHYTVFFAPAIQSQLQILAKIYKKFGLIDKTLTGLEPIEFARAVAEGMIKLSRCVGFPTRLAEIPEFNPCHIQRALKAAKNPQLEIKLKNMPIPLDRDNIDKFMGPILQAAAIRDFSLIKNL